MFRVLIGALALLATTAPAFASPCNGVDLAVGSISVKSVSTSGGLNRYNITGIVTNVGSASQGADALQSVDIYQGRDKLDSKSVPPLAAGQAFTFAYASLRSICNMVNDSFTLTF